MYKIIKYIVWFACLLIITEANATVNIALITPLNGEKSNIGKEIASGVKIAVDEINNQGGLIGEKVNLIEIEDTCDDNFSVSTAQMLALNKNPEYMPVAVIGPYCSNQLQKVADTFANAKILQIIPTAISQSNINNSHGGPIKMVGYKEQQAYDFFQFYNKYYNWMNVAVIFDNNNEEIAQAVNRAFIENKKQDKITLFRFEDNDFDYTTIAQKVLSGGAQVAFILGNEHNVTNLSKEIKSEKRKFIIVVNKYQVPENFIQSIEETNNGYFFIDLPSLKNNPEFTETLVNLRLLGIEPEGLAVYGYSAVRLWADIVRKVESFEYSAMENTLNDSSLKSGWAKLFFSNGTPLNTINYSIYKIENDEYTQVY